MGAWHFASLPKKDADRIRKELTFRPRGFGSIRVEAQIGKTKWKTSIFPESKTKTYLLPIKADVRKKESIKSTGKVAVTLKLSRDG
ncbi:MAG: DUF1905 domain-containing protein [Spirochaetia bacterium]|nr:DUF1905 domain-containing protein [Spirochaetia bacterium]